MSNYRRLISYIYAYEGGIKGKNVGFAKLEVRNGQCKIQVNVRNVYVGNQDTGVYLLSGSKEILVGRIFIRNGAGEFRVVVSVGNVAGSGHAIDQCHGLAVHNLSDSWQCYTTIWEDAVTHAAEVALEEATSERVEKEEPVEGSIAKAVEVEIEAQSRQEEKEEPAGRETPDAEDMSAMEIRPMEVRPIGKESTAVDLNGEGEEKSPEGSPEEKPDKEAAESTGPEDEPQIDSVWQRFYKTCPKIQAFDYNGGCEILTIKPQDIGLLPRETWGYGNNSFLLHGYYNHRYLIFARLNNPSGRPRFLLGVPGHYYSNEKYMAAMFGFPNFVLSKVQPTGDDRFGYWYTDVRLGF